MSTIETTTKTERQVDYEALYLALHLCCGIDGRFCFRHPFLKGEHAYATNGVICARVPASIAPWVRERQYTPDCADQAWDASLYADTPTPWPKFPKVKVEKCQICWEGARGDFPCSVHECTDMDLPLLPCPKCGMLVCNEASDHITMGRCVFNTRYVRRLARIGAVMFQPKKDDGTHPWRFTVEDLYIEGLVMPVTTEAKFYHKVEGGAS